MRYYDLSLYQADSTEIARAFTSHPNDKFDPGALNIELDLPVAPLASLTGGQTIQIEGVAMQDIMQSQTFTGMNFVLKAGMKKGLPLANPAQAGVIAQGNIYQSFGHWEGTEMYLDFVVMPSTFSLLNPGNIVLNWKSGTKLKDALNQTFKTALPKAKSEINIADSLVVPNDEIHHAYSFSDLAQVVKRITKAQGNPVELSYNLGTINAWDNTFKTDPIQIAFTDLVGQPTWVDVNTMQMKVVMRSDITIPSKIKLPPGMQSQPGMVQTQAASMPSSMKYKTAFQGDFTVIALRHLGSFRASDGASWITVINCIPNNV